MKDSHPSRPSPRLDWHGHWLTPAEFARALSRPSSTVYRWCRTGLLIDFSIPHFRDSTGRWWIKHIP